jgi:hypothetical protein
MSSTPSITLMSFLLSPSLQGANPTPQLPVTTVVVPWLLEGASRFSQVIWPS